MKTALKLALIGVLFSVALLNMRPSGSGRANSNLEVEGLVDPVKGPIVSQPVFPGISPPLRDLPLASEGDSPSANPPRLNPLANQPESKFINPEANLAAPIDPLIASGQNRSGRTPALSLSFDGTGNPVACSGCSPPDTVGDVGPNHYVQMVNATKVAIYNKSGVLVSGPFNLSTLWSSGNCTSNAGDPVVVYDPLADRWLLSQFADPNHMCMAVSQSADPTGAYFTYTFDVGSFPDYFKLGVWPDGYYMSSNESSYTAYAFDRASMLTGAAATYQKFTGGANLYLPSDLDGATPPPAGAPNYFYTFKDGAFHGGADRIEVWEFHVDWTTPANSTFTLGDSLPISAFTYTVCGFFNFDCVPQLDTTQRLDTISEWPMFRFPYRNFGDHESLVGAFTVGGGISGSDNVGAAIRWFELRNTPGGWTLYQEGTHDPGDEQDRFVPSIAMDGAGNIALGYSVSSRTLNPSIRYATRLSGDSLGTLQTEASLIAGTGSQTGSNRWGDYSAVAVDPANDCSFWYTSEYYPVDSSNQWKTRVGVFTIPECLGGGSPTPTPTNTATQPATATPTSTPTVTASPPPTETPPPTATPEPGVDLYLPFVRR